MNPDDIQAAFDETNNSIQELSDNVDNTVSDINSTIDEHSATLDDLSQNEGQLAFPLTQDTIDLIDEATNNWISYFAQMYIYNNGIGSKVVIVSAIDTFYKIDSGITAGVVSNFTFQNACEFVCQNNGTYEITFGMVIETTNNNDWQAAPMVNGVANTSIVGQNYSRGTANPSTTAGTGILTLVNGDVVSMSVLNHTGTNNITIDILTFTIKRIGN